MNRRRRRGADFSGAVAFSVAGSAADTSHAMTEGLAVGAGTRVFVGSVALTRLRAGPRPKIRRHAVVGQRARGAIGAPG